MSHPGTGNDVVPSGLDDEEEERAAALQFPGFTTPGFTIPPLKGSADGVEGVISRHHVPTQGATFRHPGRCHGLICSCQFGASELRQNRNGRRSSLIIRLSPCGERYCP